jgi:hypothetical protein
MPSFMPHLVNDSIDERQVTLVQIRISICERKKAEHLLA